MTVVRLARDLLLLAATVDVEQVWLNAAYDSAEHLVLVMGNNPKKPVRLVLVRPDVKEALSLPFKTAGAQTIEAVTEAWDQAAGDAPLDDLKLVISTIKTNVRHAGADMRKAALKGPDDFPELAEKIARKYALRARYALEYAQKQAATLGKIAAAGAGAHKTWMGPNAQCSACKALHGATVPIHSSFSVEAGGLDLGTYGALMGPPRHPNCRCDLMVS